MYHRLNFYWKEIISTVLTERTWPIEKRRTCERMRRKQQKKKTIEHTADIVKAYIQSVHVPYILCIIRNNINVDALVVFHTNVTFSLFYLSLLLFLSLFFLSMRCRFSTLSTFCRYVFYTVHICVPIYLSIYLSVSCWLASWLVGSFSHLVSFRHCVRCQWTIFLHWFKFNIMCAHKFIYLNVLNSVRHGRLSLSPCVRVFLLWFLS